MDAVEIRGLKPKLKKFLHQFRDCFGRKDTREHLSTYVEGQLSKLDRKSVEPIALAAFLEQRNPPEDARITATVFARYIDNEVPKKVREYGYEADKSV